MEKGRTAFRKLSKRSQERFRIYDSPLATQILPRSIVQNLLQYETSQAYTSRA